jgi:hypothetical protein
VCARCALSPHASGCPLPRHRWGEREARGDGKKVRGNDGESCVICMEELTRDLKDLVADLAVARNMIYFRRGDWLT